MAIVIPFHQSRISIQNTSHETCIIRHPDLRNRVRDKIDSLEEIPDRHASLRDVLRERVLGPLSFGRRDEVKQNPDPCLQVVMLASLLGGQLGLHLSAKCRKLTDFRC